MTHQTYKRLRNIIVVIGMIGGFVLWIFLPATFENNWFIHVGNSTHGSKWGLLFIVAQPLFALHEQDITIHSDDETEKNIAQIKSARKEMLLAIFCSSCTLAVMSITLLNTL